MADVATFDGAIGIDLGTTYSCVAVYIKDKVEIIPNDQGNRTTPSYVAFTETERLVGDSARNQHSKNPRNTVYDAKRLIGRKFSDKEVQNDLKTWPFKVKAGEDDGPCLEVEYKGKPHTMRPEQISGHILTRLKETAENYLGKQVTKAVVTVPAYFNDAQRTSTKLAGELAGLEVARIINEPTAAALAYGLDRKDMEKTEQVLVFDLGGGTFDVSLITIEPGPVFEVKATSGNTHLGGQDFDDSLVRYCIQEFKKKSGLDVSENNKGLRKLRTACEKAKRALSSSSTTEIEVDSIQDGEDLLVKVSRAKFEQLNMKLFEACIQEIKKVLADGKMQASDVNEVVMVGGSSRIPKVQEMVSDFFKGKTLNHSINPDEAVAYGAAIQGNILAGSKECKEKMGDMLLLDVTPLSIGLAADGGKMKVLIPRNHTIPYKVDETFWTVDDDQTDVQVDVYEGERARAKDCHFLGQFDLEGIRKAPAGDVGIKVTFDLDGNGVLQVDAMEEGSANNKMASLTITSTNKLSANQIEAMLNEAKAFAKDDKMFVKRANTRTKLETYLYQLLQEAERVEARENIRKALEKEEEWHNEKLDDASLEEMEERMDRLIEVHSRMLESPDKKKKRRRDDGDEDGVLTSQEGPSQPTSSFDAQDIAGDDEDDDEEEDDDGDEEDAPKAKKRKREPKEPRPKKEPKPKKPKKEKAPDTPRDDAEEKETDGATEKPEASADGAEAMDETEGPEGNAASEEKAKEAPEKKEKSETKEKKEKKEKKEPKETKEKEKKERKPRDKTEKADQKAKEDKKALKDANGAEGEGADDADGHGQQPANTKSPSKNPEPSAKAKKEKSEAKKDRGSPPPPKKKKVVIDDLDED